MIDRFSNSFYLHRKFRPHQTSVPTFIHKTNQNTQNATRKNLTSAPSEDVVFIIVLASGEFGRSSTVSCYREVF